MKEVKETTLLEFHKSAFLIDLVKHDSGSHYIEITQSIKNDKKGEQQIKINPSILEDLIRVLKNYKAKIPKKTKTQTNYISDVDQKSIQNRYLKGVPISGLALQFDQTEEIIEMVLRNRGISIVSNEPPKYRKRKRRKRY